ncbi:hypothetical protein A2159_03070 [Candidatus Woesebacteria bacterium RBG_13_34_9]|uniref:POTRA domain-containing protein n=1 Tax=Candidatus Woesebacteria bacterium RBG_13_34_9 TaxID=1802477 RepID=A0A1F7X2X6_9BACT|nr:MAG: hypothetical protein A2159_03070 [Candidatus Woesebacteria bacterium RBG_13_34_9]
MKRIKLLFKLLIILLSISIIYFLPSLIPVKEIVCVTNQDICNKRINEKFKDFQNVNLRSAKKTIGNLLKNDASVSNYNFQYKINGRLIVNIIENIPQYSISNPDKQWKSLISRDGIILSVSDNSNLPILVIDESLPSIGNKVDDKILFSLKILDSLSKRQKVKYAKYSSNELLIDMDNGLKVIFPVEGEIRLLLGSYYLIDNKLKNLDEDSKMNGYTYNILDLRFNDPVLKKIYDEK